MKMFCIAQIIGGQPNVDPVAAPFNGYVLCDQVGNYGAYLFSGTQAQLTAIAALPQVLSICTVTESDTLKWGELDTVISSTIRTKMNTWLTNNHPAWPQVPAGATYRQVIKALYQKFNVSFDLSLIDIIDG